MNLFIFSFFLKTICVVRERERERDNEIARAKAGDMLIRSIENEQAEWFYRKESIVRT
tara:strand:- start:1880 stop:2053 length:174 start_codon:yes stop_codon:yes gene_type:complete